MLVTIMLATILSHVLFLEFIIMLFPKGKLSAMERLPTSNSRGLAFGSLSK